MTLFWNSNCAGTYDGAARGVSVTEHIRFLVFMHCIAKKKRNTEKKRAFSMCAFRYAKKPRVRARSNAISVIKRTKIFFRTNYKQKMENDWIGFFSLKKKMIQKNALFFFKKKTCAWYVIDTLVIFFVQETYDLKSCSMQLFERLLDLPFAVV